MNHLRIILILVSVLMAGGCGQDTARIDYEDGLAAFSADSLKTHISVLASDSFLGRRPFTEGEHKTITYLEQQFRMAGMEPGNGNSFFQEVPMVNILAMAEPVMNVKSSGGDFQLKAYDEYIIWTDKTDQNIRLENAELVFAGYGVVAPEHGWNDYKEIDVKDKVVLVMINDPGFWSGDGSLFRGDTMTYYGRWTYKFEEAARQGARGCLIIHNTRAAGYPFIVQQNKFNASRLLLHNGEKKGMDCDVIGWLPESTAVRLFRTAGFDSTLFMAAGRQDFKPVPLGLTVSTSMSVQSTFDTSYNVIGKITGTKRPDEVIIYTAHWDHLGVGRPDEKGDSIYNGAFDNATGTAGLLELARAFKSMKKKPERTIVFLSVTAEEQQLLGSAYYAQNPVYHPAKTVANINLECLNWSRKTNDMTIIGKGQSELEDYLEEEMARTGGYISYETHPEAGLYYRSDHFSFAKAGIPALYAVSGIDVAGQGKEAGKRILEEYRQKNYHRPSDEYNPATWTMEGAIIDLQRLFQVGKRVAAEKNWVQWKPGSEFRAVREQHE